jgi:trehalose-6-phosphate synthase
MTVYNAQSKGTFPHSRLGEALAGTLDRLRAAVPRSAGSAPSSGSGDRDVRAWTAGAVAYADEWTEPRLRAVFADKLAGADVVFVSNREPYVHTFGTGGVHCEMPAGGLVSALEPIAESCGGTWIAHGSGSADRDTVDAQDRIGVPPAAPTYTLRRIWLSDEEHRGYYLGFANESLWPLCHTAFVRPVFRAEDWEHYVAVNRRFAEAVVRETSSRSPVVFVQDYHFALLPRMIRERLPDATIVSFWHIPWPNSEVFGICPYAAEILDGLLGSDIIGFHIPLYGMNFTECVERTLESRVNREDWSIQYGGQLSFVRNHAISIAAPEAAARPAPAETPGLDPSGTSDARVVLGVSRLDYTKGIPECLTAFERLLHDAEDWRGRVRLVFIAAPTRSEIQAYQDLRATCRRLTEEINARYGTAEYTPVTFIDHHVARADLAPYYRAADICIVPSLHDGMNLVGKEYVAHRDAGDGVLILSKFAGAIHELPEALAINPFDAAHTAQTLQTALEMAPAEQAERMQRMRETVRNHNIYRWAGHLLEDAAQCRERNRLAALESATIEPPGTANAGPGSERRHADSADP